MSEKKVIYLMRGLPSSGKSHTAKILAGQKGVVLETDEYFYTQVGNDPTHYDYQHKLLGEARQWNYERFKQGIAKGITPIIVDRGNSLATETQIYARYAVDHDYQVELREPDSEWWQEIRVLLKYKQVTQPVLWKWADVLSRMSQSSHRTPVEVIRRRMAKWKSKLTVEDILDYDIVDANIQQNEIQQPLRKQDGDKLQSENINPEQPTQTLFFDIDSGEFDTDSKDVVHTEQNWLSMSGNTEENSKGPYDIMDHSLKVNHEEKQNFYKRSVINWIKSNSDLLKKVILIWQRRKNKLTMNRQMTMRK